MTTPDHRRSVLDCLTYHSEKGLEIEQKRFVDDISPRKAATDIGRKGAMSRIEERDALGVQALADKTGLAKGVGNEVCNNVHHATSRIAKARTVSIASRPRSSASADKPLSRIALIKAIETGLGERLPLPDCFPLLMRSDRKESNELALEIDGSPFSGGPTGFPQPEKWQDDLVSPLHQTAGWLRRNGQSRIALQGSYRLTTAMVLGNTLRAAHGFELEISSREGVLQTDDHGCAQAASDDWTLVMPTTLKDGEISVCIGVIRDPSATISQTAGTTYGSMLMAHLPKAITSGREAQNGVALIKDSVTKAVASLKPQRLRLYFAGPASFAVALGHRWNAMPPTQLHEYLADEHRYVPTACI
jgi:hypothetical protein